VSDAATSAVPPSRIGGKYLPLRVIGRGGMSVVYEVEHEFTGERLALKVLKGRAGEVDPVTLSRFQREARLSSLVKSPHIVRVLDADLAPELDRAPFLVMDLLRGVDLAMAIAGRAEPPRVVVSWMRQLALALDKAHAHGIVHRDLKPENLFLAFQEDGRAIVTVLDFGVAKIRFGDDVRRTATGAVVGTPLYMSPEQASGSDLISPAADVWAIGLLGYRLLTGSDYWDAPTVSLLLAQIVYAPLEPPSAKGSKLGERFDAWFLRSCAREPAERWSSVGEQVEALAEALDVQASGEEFAFLPEHAARIPESIGVSPARRAQTSANDTALSMSIAGESPAKRGARMTAVAAAGVLAAAGSAALLFGVTPERPHATASRAHGAAIESIARAVPAQPREPATVPVSPASAPALLGASSSPLRRSRAAPSASSARRARAQPSLSVSAAAAPSPPFVRDPLAEPH
jgi:serine/threonine-protein kinase